ncbi:hypothetical protein [Mycobacterium sp. TY815]|uniref:hypothetical protein n=1 Tax=Mycobacterium sp. TY815 TaxID=3050581 RepID=UPI002741DC7D|nr:hypothetical protein [Mycobacterium sp. TY815]MDP7706801.1 hypothetical protein [Mycobacterium sp. TY815]
MVNTTENPNLTTIPDEAEVWLILAENVTDIATKIPSSPTADLAALGWEFTGMIDDKKGIPLDPTIEVKEYDAFGRPRFRIKLRKGALKTGFTALEMNSTTRKIVLPGSAPNKIGAPKDVQVYVLYRFVDEDRATVWVQLTKCPVELKGHGGIVDGELSWAELTVHHTTDANGDIFQVVDASTDDVVKTFTIAAGVSAYTATVDGSTSASITAKTKAALQAALRALSTVQALPTPGVTVDGPDGGPLVATFTGPVTTVSAAGTGGTVTVA